MRKRTPSEVRRLIATDAPPTVIPISSHHSHHYLNLVRTLGASAEPISPAISIAPEEIESARAKFGLTNDRPWLGLNPGAEYGPAKRWPAERFAEAAIAVRAKINCRCVIFGGPNDRPITSRVAQIIGESVLDLTGKTTLRELAASLAICEMVLTNDSGPMHLAAAVGTRVVAIFGSTSPELTAPPGARIVRQQPPCAPCFLRECPIDLRCLRGIDVARVVDELLATK